MWIDIIIATSIMLFLAFAIGLLLVYLNKVLKIEQNDVLNELKDMLPGANCGVCGYVNCEGFAKALLSKEANDASYCKVSTKENIKIINDYVSKVKK